MCAASLCSTLLYSALIACVRCPDSLLVILLLSSIIQNPMLVLTQKDSPFSFIVVFFSSIVLAPVLLDTPWLSFFIRSIVFTVSYFLIFPLLHCSSVCWFSMLRSDCPCSFVLGFSALILISRVRFCFCLCVVIFRFHFPLSWLSVFYVSITWWRVCMSCNGSGMHLRGTDRQSSKMSEIALKL